ncbi:hypothetical protein ACWGOQ_0002180 [Aquimarina sp. M1]
MVKAKMVKKPDWTKTEVVDNNVALQKLRKERNNGNNRINPAVIPMDSIIDVLAEEKITFPIDKVTMAPIYPGCEKFSYL